MLVFREISRNVLEELSGGGKKPYFYKLHAIIAIGSHSHNMQFALLPNSVDYKGNMELELYVINSFLREINSQSIKLCSKYHE